MPVPMATAVLVYVTGVPMAAVAAPEPRSVARAMKDIAGATTVPCAKPLELAKTNRIPSMVPDGGVGTDP